MVSCLEGPPALVNLVMKQIVGLGQELEGAM